MEFNHSKGHRKSGVISIKYSRDTTYHLEWNNVRFLPVSTTYICRDASRTKNLTLLMKEGHCMRGPADL